MDRTALGLDHLRDPMPSRLTLLLLAPALLPVSSPLHDGGSDPQAGWFTEVILRAPGKLSGCAVGDVDPVHPGNEVVAVCASGQVFLARVTNGHWVGESIAVLDGEPIQVALGEVLPDRPGAEVLVVGTRNGSEQDGGPGAAHLISRAAGLWSVELVLEDSALLHAACIVELDPERPGAEVALAGFSNTLRFLARDASGTWEELATHDLPGAGKALVAFGDGVAVACTDGSLLLVSPGTEPRLLDHAPAGLARLATATSADRGALLLVARDDGKLVLLDSAGERTEIHAEPERLRGAVLADLDPARPGLEAATAGYARRLSVLYAERGAWVARTLLTDDDGFHHVAVGELDPASPGPELVACGISGRLVLAGVERIR